MKAEIRRAVTTVLESPEYLVFDGFFSIFGKICRHSLKQRVIRKYGPAIKAAFLNLRRVVVVEFDKLPSAGEKMDFVRVLRRSASAYTKFHQLDL